MPQPILIVAHPGHELMLFHWMERLRPRVFVLTDGAGSSGRGRTDFSRACVAAAGASAGAVFGGASDRDWYAAMARGDVGPFAAAVEAILADLDAPPELVVADPVEGYNPMHDLCAAVGAAVQARLALSGAVVRLAAYPLTSPAPADGPARTRLPLDAEACARKRTAIAAYAPLQVEAAALLAEAPQTLACERLVDGLAVDAWPGALARPPQYELFGRERAARGLYAQAFTYEDHVAPIGRALLGQAAEAPAAAAVPA